jgi:hypothetical protein
MMPQVVAGPVDGYVDLLRRELGGAVAAVYAAGSLALGDFSQKQSNIDLVVVRDATVDPGQMGRLRRAERALDRQGRKAAVWHTTWEEVSGGPAAMGTDPAGGPSPLATPLTWSILRNDPMPLFGPDWPVVWEDKDVLRAWALERLRAIASAKHGLLLLRRDVGPLVLGAARLAQVAITRRVLSKSEAGDSVVALLPSSRRRILVDSVGYRQGAQTSMYWGPFERKYDALRVVEDLARTAAESS